jgi:hypothetical protein
VTIGSRCGANSSNSAVNTATGKGRCSRRPLPHLPAGGRQ